MLTIKAATSVFLLSAFATFGIPSEPFSIPAGAALPGPPAMLFPILIGPDNNGVQNGFVQPTDPALAGGGRDQSLQHHDLLVGNQHDINVIIGRLGEDAIVGGQSVDFIIGGPEHFFPRNRDKAFGNSGDDVFMWAPGDGSDRFDGGPGDDTLIFGLIGEDDGSGNPIFQVHTDMMAGNVWLDAFGLPRVDVTNSPGFCEVLDDATNMDSAEELDLIGMDHLVRFFIRSVNEDFVNGVQNTDNGLRVTLHLTSVEYLVCTSRAGGQIEAFDLTTSPPTQIPFTSLPFAVQFTVQ